MSLQAILFDCDGVIADSEELWNEIDAEMLAHFGHPGYHGELKPLVLGKSFTLSLEVYREQFGLRVTAEEMLPVRIRVGAEVYRTRVPTFPGVHETLESLRADGFRLALATSSVSQLILPFLERHDIKRYFHAIVTGEMVRHGKPNPDIYLKAAAEVGVSPRESLVVEDALAGLQAGRAAGARTVAIPDERWGDPAQFVGAADFIVADLPAVLPLIDGLRRGSLPGESG